MQTFTPYSDFEESLRALDLKRLGKQRVEVIQIVRALNKRSAAAKRGWKTRLDKATREAGRLREVGP